jgi:hypothetical protein
MLLLQAEATSIIIIVEGTFVSKFDGEDFSMLGALINRSPMSPRPLEVSVLRTLYMSDLKDLVV